MKKSSLKNKNHLATEITGWIGVILILMAYFLGVFGYIEPKSLSYSSINLTGAVLLVVHAALNRDKEVTMLNMIWAAVALVAIIKLLF
jgi:protein-S-isoprenylcysteine O-methyltransferase Ste14